MENFSKINKRKRDDCSVLESIPSQSGFRFQKGLPFKIGIKCFSRFLLVAHGRKPSKPLHGPQTANQRGRQKKCVQIFLNFTYLHKTKPGQKTAGNFPNFLKISTHQMFGYPDLDAGLNTSQFGGDTNGVFHSHHAFSDRQHRPRLTKPCLRHFKSGDKTF